MSDQPHYPYRDGDHAVLGPDVTATPDGMTITWQGANYRRDHGEHVGAATPLICSDERHAAKVAALQAELDRLREDLGAALGRADADRASLIEVRMRERARQAAIERVRDLHRKASHGETCVYCAHGQRLGYDTTWPCDTIRALDGVPSATAATQATEPHTGLVVEPYRNDRGEQAWVFRCWGSDNCDGWLSLDHTSRQSAERARDRHVTEEHAEPAEPATVTDPEWLRQQYAAVIQRWWDADDGGAEEIADAVMRVHDRYVAQLQQRLRLADQLVSENTELHRYHAEDRDQLTEMRATITRLRGEREQQRQRADQAEELLRIAHATSNTSEAEHARAQQRADRLASLAREIIHATHNITSQDWARWRERLNQLADQERAAHNAGPTVAEAVADDARWWNGEKAGE